MRLKVTLTALPAAALLLAGTVGLAGAQSIPPHIAAQLNAGTAYTAFGPSGEIGVGISAVYPEVMELLDVEVAGVQFGYLNDGGPQTVSTLGVPTMAALLNAGTAYTGIGRFGVVGDGIDGALPTSAVTAQAGMDSYTPY